MSSTMFFDCRSVEKGVLISRGGLCCRCLEMSESLDREREARTAERGVFLRQNDVKGIIRYPLLDLSSIQSICLEPIKWL